MTATIHVTEGEPIRVAQISVDIVDAPGLKQKWTRFSGNSRFVKESFLPWTRIRERSLNKRLLL